jgi:hypothetical protein
MVRFSRTFIGFQNFLMSHNPLNSSYNQQRNNTIGTSGPTAPVIRTASGDGRRSADPAAARLERYPIPTFFEYRERSRSFEVL